MMKYAALAILFSMFLLFCAGCAGNGDAGMGGDMRSGGAHYGAGGSLPGNCTDCSVN